MGCFDVDLAGVDFEFERDGLRPAAEARGPPTADPTRSSWAARAALAAAEEEAPQTLLTKSRLGTTVAPVVSAAEEAEAELALLTLTSLSPWVAQAGLAEAVAAIVILPVISRAEVRAVAAAQVWAALCSSPKMQH